MWRVISPEMQTWLLGAGNPPGDIAGVIGDPSWCAAFAMWADDYTLQVQDVFLQHHAFFAQAYHEGKSIEELYQQFGSNDGYYQIEWGNELTSDFAFAAQDAQWEANVRPRLWAFTTEYLAQYHAPFVEDVESIAGVSDPERQSIGYTDFDYDYIDSVNQVNLKDAEEGDQLPFMQRGEVLLIGPGFPDTYVQYAQQGSQGTITMVSRGSFGSTGEIEVSGAEDEATFKEGVRRFSKKEITFV